MSWLPDVFDLDAQAAELARGWHHVTLRELSELTMDYVREVHHHAMHAPAGHKPDPAQGMLFTRLTRCVRQTVALDARLATPSPGPGPDPGDTVPAQHLDHEPVEYRSQEAPPDPSPMPPEPAPPREYPDWYHRADPADWIDPPDCPVPPQPPIPPPPDTGCPDQIAALHALAAHILAEASHPQPPLPGPHPPPDG